VRGLTLAIGLACSGALSRAEDWPQWRGPRRDGLSRETGLLKKWPEDGPKRLWTARGLGIGFSSMAVANSMIFTAGDKEGKTFLTALDLDGKLLWQTPNGPAWKGNPAGSRSTPTVDDGRVYYLSAHGNLLCADARTGKPIWSLNILERFQGRNITWGLAESPLIDGEKLICCPGGPRSAMVALDKKTGKTVWVCPGAGDKPGYASAIAVEQDGLRLYVTMTSRAAIGVAAETGKLLWRLPHKTAYDCNIPTPIYHAGHIFIDSGYGSGGALLRLVVKGQGAGVQEVWRTKTLDNHHGGVILVEGYLYGSSHRGKWVCLDIKTGKAAYVANGVGKGSVTYADGMLYTYSERGAMGLVPATPTGHNVVSRFRVPPGGSGPFWAHPVVSGGRLYLRHADALHCYDIARH